jgi:hypothetical protein
MNALDPILESTRADVERRRARTPVADLPPRDGPIRPFTLALGEGPGISVIA